MAIDRKGNRLFIGCSNEKMAVVDTLSGKVVATIPIGEGVDGNAFDPGTNLAFSSNGSGSLTVVRAEGADKYSVAGNIPTQRGARTMALDAATHRVFVVTADFGPPPSPTAAEPHPRPSRVPDSFTILVVDR